MRKVMYNKKNFFILKENRRNLAFSFSIYKFNFELIYTVIYNI